MSADEHFARAREHSESAAAMSRGYRGGPAGTRTASYPWYYYWDPAAEHEELARAHAKAGVDLDLDYQAACADEPRGHDVGLPLDDATGSDRAEKGIVFHLPFEAGPPDHLLARLRCRRAWAMAFGAADDPTSVDGIVWVAHTGTAGFELVATAPDPLRETELVRRVTLARAKHPRVQAAQ